MLCREEAKLIRDRQNANVHGIREGEARHRKYGGCQSFFVFIY
jgi:hypothetical protein